MKASRVWQQTLLVLLLTMTALNVLSLIAGAAPLDVYRTLLGTTLGSAYGSAQVLFKATPLLLLGLAAALALQAGQLNIGLEGQLILGSLAMGLTGAALPAELPGVLGAALVCLAGALAGAAWAALPALLKLRFRAPEVTTSIMANLIAALLANWAVKPFAVAESTHTAELAEQFRFASLEAWALTRGAQLSSAFALALLIAVALHVFLYRTERGFHWRAVGRNADAARQFGVPTPRVTLLAFLGSGALAGLAASTFVLGSKGFHEDGFSGGIGFLALGVAMLAKSNPLAVIPSALLFGLLSYGALAINALVPKEMTDVLTACIMVTTIVVFAPRRRG